MRTTGWLATVIIGARLALAAGMAGAAGAAFDATIGFTAVGSWEATCARAGEIASATMARVRICSLQLLLFILVSLPGQNFSGAPPQSIHLVIWFVQFQVSCFQFLAPLELETGNLKLP